MIIIPYNSQADIIGLRVTLSTTHAFMFYYMPLINVFYFIFIIIMDVLYSSSFISCICVMFSVEKRKQSLL